MKISIFDSVEFETTASEEFVAIAIGEVKTYKNFRLFFRKTNEFDCFKEFNSSFSNKNVESTLDTYTYSRNVILTYVCVLISRL